MAPPSSGPLAVLQMLGELEQYPMSRYAPNSAQAVHYFAEAGRLAFADRDFYVADPDFVKVPVRALLDPAYLRARRADPAGPQHEGRAARRPRGRCWAWAATRRWSSHPPATWWRSTRGDAISMTTTIENEFGSKIFVRGFLLNNEMTDFSSAFKDPEAGWPTASNRASARAAPWRP